MSASANEAVVRLAIDAIWNRGNLDVADELFSPEYMNVDSQLGNLVAGPETIKLSAAFYRLAFPDLHVTVEWLAANVDTVVVHWIASRGPPNRDGTGHGPAAAADGNHAQPAGWREIVETRTDWDGT